MNKTSIAREQYVYWLLMNKMKCIFILVLLVSSLNPSFSQVQNPSSSVSNSLECLFPEIMDSLHYYQDYCKSLKRYAKQFKKLRKGIVASDSLELYKEIGHYLDWMVDHPEADSVYLRKQYTYYGYGFRKHINNIQLAIYYYEIAHKYYNNSLTIDDYWFVENALGIMYNIHGDHERASFFYKKAIKGFDNLISSVSHNKEKFLKLRTRTKNNLGYVYFWNKEYDKSIKILKSSMIDASISKNNVALSFSSSYLAETYYELYQIDSLKKYTALLFDVIPSLDKERSIISNMSYHLLRGKLYLLEDKPTKAITELKWGLKSLNQSKRSKAKTCKLIARAYLNLDSLKSALFFLDLGFEELSLSYLKLFNEQVFLSKENTIAELSELLAEYFNLKYIKTNENEYLDSSIICLNRAMDVYDLLRADYLLKGSKLLSLVDNRRIIDKSVGIHYLKQLSQGENEIVTQLVNELFSKSKNLLLSELNRERKRIEDFSKDRRSVITNLQSNIHELTIQLSKDNNSKNRDSLESEIVEYRIKLKDYLKETKNLEINNLKTPFVEYFMGSQFVYRIDDFSGKQIFRKLVARQEIDTMIMHSLKYIVNKNYSDSFYNNQAKLYDVLFDDMRDIPSEFTIIPDDKLCFVSFPALITNRTKRRYLVQDYLINIAFGKSEIMKTKNQKSSHLVVIAPYYPKVILTKKFKNNRLAYLPHAKNEIQLVTDSWKGVHSSYTNLTKQIFFKSLVKATNLHYAGHTIITETDGYLALSNDTSSWVSMDEVSQSPFYANSVVLSGCETGIGQLEYGEGVNSLAKSFLQSGTSSIMYSLWSINDQLTSKLMKTYYIYQSQGLNMLNSFTKAQRDFLEENQGKYVHPYYWAAFVVMDTSQNNRSAQNSNISYGLLFMSFLALIYIITKLKT